MQRKRVEIKCIDPSNPNPSQRCVRDSRPFKGSYNCRYCGRVMEIQFEDDAKDVESFGGKNERRNVTTVGVGQDTSSMLLKGGDDKQTQSIRQEFTNIFMKLDGGNEAIENAMHHYERYQKMKLKSRDSHGVDKMKKVKKENMIKGISMLVIQERNITVEKVKLKRLLQWDLADCFKQRDNVRQILGLKKHLFNNDHDGVLREKCNNLGIGQYATQCMTIAPAMFTLMEGKHPTTIIACIIYFICQVYHITSVTEGELASQCGASAETLKKTFRMLCDGDKMEKIKALIKE